MHSSELRGRRGRVAAGVAAGLFLLAGGVLLVETAEAGPRYERSGSLHSIAMGDLVYSYDPVWAVEKLHVLDPETGIGRPFDPEGEDGTRVESLRSALLRHLGCGALAEIPREGRKEYEAIKALGYL